MVKDVKLIYVKYKNFTQWITLSVGIGRINGQKGFDLIR